MFKKHTFIIVLLFCSISVASYAEQQELADPESTNETNFYLGGVFGKADTEQTFDDQYTLEGRKFFQDSSTNVYGVYAGFNFNRTWAIEGAVLYLPDIDERPSEIPIDDVYMTVFTLTPVLHFDFNRNISLFIKAGIGYLIYIEDFKKHGIEGSRHSDDDTWAAPGFAWGLGFEIDLSESLSTRIGYDYLNADLEADDENHHEKQGDVDGEMSLLSLSLQYNF